MAYTEVLDNNNNLSFINNQVSLERDVKGDDINSTSTECWRPEWVRNKGGCYIPVDFSMNTELTENDVKLAEQSLEKPELINWLETNLYDNNSFHKLFTENVDYWREFASTYNEIKSNPALWNTDSESSVSNVSTSDSATGAVLNNSATVPSNSEVEINEEGNNAMLERMLVLLGRLEPGLFQLAMLVNYIKASLYCVGLSTNLIKMLEDELKAMLNYINTLSDVKKVFAILQSRQLMTQAEVTERQGFSAALLSIVGATMETLGSVSLLLMKITDKHKTDSLTKQYDEKKPASGIISSSRKAEEEAMNNLGAENTIEEQELIKRELKNHHGNMSQVEIEDKMEIAGKEEDIHIKLDVREFEKQMLYFATLKQEAKKEDVKKKTMEDLHIEKTKSLLNTMVDKETFEKIEADCIQNPENWSKYLETTSNLISTHKTIETKAMVRKWKEEEVALNKYIELQQKSDKSKEEKQQLQAIEDEWKLKFLTASEKPSQYLEEHQAMFNEHKEHWKKVAQALDSKESVISEYRTKYEELRNQKGAAKKDYLDPNSEEWNHIVTEYYAFQMFKEKECEMPKDIKWAEKKKTCMLDLDQNEIESLFDEYREEVRDDIEENVTEYKQEMNLLAQNRKVNDEHLELVFNEKILSEKCFELDKLDDKIKHYKQLKALEKSWEAEGKAIELRLLKARLSTIESKIDHRQRMLELQVDFKNEHEYRQYEDQERFEFMEERKKVFGAIKKELKNNMKHEIEARHMPQWEHIVEHAHKIKMDYKREMAEIKSMFQIDSKNAERAINLLVAIGRFISTVERYATTQLNVSLKTSESTQAQQRGTGEAETVILEQILQQLAKRLDSLLSMIRDLIAASGSNIVHVN